MRFRVLTSSILLLLTVWAGLLTSCKPVKLADADRHFRNGEYYQAGTMYRKMYRKIPPKDKELRGTVAYRLAESYRLTSNVVSANAAYINAIRYNTDTLVHLQYGRTLHKAGNYKLATSEYKIFQDKYPNNIFVENALIGAENAPEWKANPTKYIVKRMEVFNSRRGEFSPMLLPPEYDLIYITTNRDDVQGEAKSAITGQYNNDIFVARKDENGKWMKPESAGAVNSEFDEGTPSFSASGSLMYYTFCNEDPEKSANAAIYRSRRGDGEWSKGERLAFTSDSSYMYAHPALSLDGKYLYFVSDMPGGYGGKDIWRAAMFDDDVSYIENLGPDINTAGDEMFPFMRNDSTLYFSSDGHPGLGGLDLFKAVFNHQTTSWSIENMGVPINSQGDDFGITFDKDSESGFFSSNREQARGADHIYSFEYPIIKVGLEGYIVDKDDDFIPNATIRIVGNDGTNEKFNGKPDGTYRFQVEQGVNYVLLASADGFLNSKMDLKTIIEEKDSTYYVDFVLYSINKPAVLENIFYDFDKAALREDSKKELDDLIELLEINPHVTIELSAHTDRKGTQEYNQRLSQRRAQSVVDYLIAHRISKDRLTVAGYGKMQPKTISKGIAKRHDFLKEGDVLTEEFILSLPVEQQEIADQINRRTEFKVLSTSYNLR